MLPFNDLPDDEARALLLGCLSVPRWAEDVLAGRPYVDRLDLIDAADAAARQLSDDGPRGGPVGPPADR